MPRGQGNTNLSPLSPLQVREDKAAPSFKVSYWVCGEGHIFSYGDEDWHYEYRQSYNDQEDNDYIIPSHCQADFDDGEPCMTSSYLWGPFTEHEALAKRDGLLKNKF